MKNDLILSKVKKIFEGIFPEKFALNRKQAQYRNWDSFAHMELISKIEQEFSISLSLEDTVAIESAQDVIRLLNKKA